MTTKQQFRLFLFVFFVLVFEMEIAAIYLGVLEAGGVGGVGGLGGGGGWLYGVGELVLGGFLWGGGERIWGWWGELTIHDILH